MNSLEYALRELKLAGYIGGRPKKNDPSDLSHRECGKAALQLLQLFRKQGHSGYSAVKTMAIFAALVERRPLSANDHSCYEDVSREFCGPRGTVKHDTRDGRFLSIDGGKTWFDAQVEGAWAKVNKTAAGRRLRRHQKQLSKKAKASPSPVAVVRTRRRR